jgi:WD40 repeat protein
VVLDLAIGPTSARSFDAQGLTVIPSKRNAISRDGQLFACGPSSGPVLALDTRSGATVGLPVGIPTVFPGIVVFSPDNSHVAVSYRQENKRRDYVTVRNLHTGQEISSFTGHTLGHGCIAFDADGSRIVTGGMDKTAILWDARTGREILTMRGQDSPVTSVEFSPDNSRLAVGCHDGSIHIWDVRPFEDR